MTQELKEFCSDEHKAVGGVIKGWQLLFILVLSLGLWAGIWISVSASARLFLH